MGGGLTLNGSDHALLVAASRLADHLMSAGEVVPRCSPSVRLDAGEAAFAELDVNVATMCGADVSYSQSSFVMFGGSGLFALTAGASALGNRRRRREAEQLAAVQWRGEGRARVVLSTQRALVFNGLEWYSWWYGGIRQLHPGLPQLAVDLVFEGRAPARLSAPAPSTGSAPSCTTPPLGAGAPYVAVLLAWLLYGEILDVPRPPPPPPPTRPRLG